MRFLEYAERLDTNRLILREKPESIGQTPISLDEENGHPVHNVSEKGELPHAATRGGLLVRISQRRATHDGKIKVINIWQYLSRFCVHRAGF